MPDFHSLCQTLPPAAPIVGFIVYSVWEYLIGKTKYGSTVGLLVEHPIATAIKKARKNDNR